MKSKRHLYLLLILIVIFVICVLPLRNIPSKDYLALIHDLFKIFLSILSGIVCLSLFITGLGVLIMTIKYLVTLKGKWRNFMYLIFVSIIGVCIYHLRTISIEDFLSVYNTPQKLDSTLRWMIL